MQVITKSHGPPSNLVVYRGLGFRVGVYIGVIFGFYMDNIGTTEKNMETTVVYWGYIRIIHWAEMKRLGE